MNNSFSLITLNIWGGQVKEPLMEFIKTHQHIDIFCFQEVYHNAEERISDDNSPVHLNIFQELQENLPEHQGIFKPVVRNMYGIAIFVKKAIEVHSEGEIQIHDNDNYVGRGPTHSRNLQWIECCINGKIFSIMNIHGLWNGMGKNDSLPRIEQSRRIKEFLKSRQGPVILCGDFNLRPDTKSIEILEEKMHNQIKIHKIASTRTNFYPKQEKFADYVFTSPEIKVSSFKVLDYEVSDHAPLLLEVSV